jgi:FAD binding domain
VSLLPLTQVTILPDPTTVQLGRYNGESDNELKTIELREPSPSGRLCRIGAAVTNDEFRRWQVQHNWATPVDTLLVEVTIAGITQGICHGGGLSHPTISDHVKRVEYVDPNGNLQTVDDPLFLTAAAGNFGLLGIVTHITLELNPIKWAMMQPRKIDVCLAVPPLLTTDIPIALRKGWCSGADAGAKLLTAIDDFESRAQDYFSEWIWCP